MLGWGCGELVLGLTSHREPSGGLSTGVTQPEQGDIATMFGTG